MTNRFDDNRRVRIFYNKPTFEIEHVMTIAKVEELWMDAIAREDYDEANRLRAIIGFAIANNKELILTKLIKKI